MIVWRFTLPGETVELGNIVSYSRRFAVPLIAAGSASHITAVPATRPCPAAPAPVR